MHRRLSAAALVAVAAALAAAPAHAHQGNPDYRSVIEAVKPAISGLNVQVLNYDDRLQLENDTGKTVIVEGYEGEPYVRIAADGNVAVNTRSPAYYLNDDRFGDVQVPDSANPKAPPQWQEVDGTGQYQWHDHRIHYMGTGTPSQVTDTDKKTKIFDYRVPLEVGSERAAITGTLYWVGEAGGFPIAPFVALGVVAMLAFGTIAVARRRNRPRPESVEPSEPSGPTKEAW
jgi:hypothetical protein